ncbi:2-C-methyl-D-erythritol 4-phosphate cytidylyltransferase [Larsenimonas rhizosphaerae]|uniref:2-C-methyl-D-erythritol 4-phosphate cytidylyltransferase n=1 Tax=Larsenimonas rhizosphaerae TaxID=2944682 RepID=A0AA41ZN07_9GAMM|nr:2-C-methyl-D-erythritol 4-phosphate cytidylyltransferase [Larsenimonas rhizosphaerae]MCX2524878.1 2-C-methyl-D-erythritol 4-phosphate cytidylyltransferase [Larsenimonas rhizosphaerae]
MTLFLVVPAAGVGSRMKADRPKQYLLLQGRPLMAHTLSRLHDAFPEAVLVLCLDHEDDRFDASMVPFARWQRVRGGETRAESVRAGLASVAEQAAPDDLVLVHDVARPCVQVEDLYRLHAAAGEHADGALLAAPVADTMKRADDCGGVLRTESRAHLFHALTPQGFRYDLLCQALDAARAGGVEVTDEASAIEALGRSPRLVPGRRDNIKVTHPEDLALAGALLALPGGD